MRIRSIKPEFWRSRDVTSLPWDTRLVFIGLWSYVDDNGVGWDDLPSIAADLFARDLSVDSTETLRRVSQALSGLEEKGLVVRYKADGKDLLMITGWAKHQLVKNPSTGHNYPIYQAKEHVLAEPLLPLYGESTETLGTGTGEQGNRGTGELTLAQPQAVEHVNDARFEEFWRIYPRHMKRADALKAFRQMVKAGTSPEEIIAGAQSFASDPNLPEKKFIPYPASWLRAEGWLDDPLPARGRQQSQHRPSRVEENMQVVAELMQQQGGIREVTA